MSDAPGADTGEGAGSDAGEGAGRPRRTPQEQAAWECRRRRAEIFGDAIEYPVRWKQGSDVSSLAGKAVRLRFVLREADLFALRFRPRTKD